ncbi:MAG: hypothetical protein Q8Q33_04045 [Chlamydiota bacterium]|nr:hypothetical protein [Chlamydiota bacterium]
MNKQYQKNALKKLIFAWINLTLGSVLMIKPVLHLIGNIAIGKFFILFGFVMFVVGCLDVAAARGYHRGWGFLGIFNVLGLCILFVMPDMDESSKGQL